MQPHFAPRDASLPFDMQILKHKDVVTASATVIYQGHEIKLLKNYPVKDFNIEQARKDLHAQLGNQLRKVNDEKENVTFPHLVIPAAKSERDVAPARAQETARLTLSQKKYEKAAAPSQTRRTAELTALLRNPGITMSVSNTSDYHLLKERFGKNPRVSVEFNDDQQEVTFFHHEKEIACIFAVEKLGKMLPASLSVTRQALALTRAKRTSLHPVQSSRDAIVQRIAELSQAADVYLSRANPAYVPVPESTQKKDVIETLLKNRAGICIGESSHSDITPKKFLIENMQKFKQEGVTTLFLEHVFYDSTQKWMDEYLKSPPGTPMPLYLERYLSDLDYGQNNLSKENTFINVVKAAKMAGIRVVGTDTVVSYLSGAHDKEGIVDEEARVKGMNVTAAQIIEREKGKGKFIAFMGGAHVGSMHGIPGVANLLHCPSMLIEDNNQPAESLVCNKIPRLLVDQVGVYLKLPVTS